MVFVESQSSWSINILVRILLYLADTIQAYLHDTQKDIHSKAQLWIPQPEFYVIYTGTDTVPATISLRKHFFFNQNSPLDLQAKVFNAETNDIIGQYIIFCRVLDDQVRKLGRTKEAAEEAIQICRNRGLLMNSLTEREKEVIDSMVMLFDQEYAVRQYGIAQKNEGRILERIDMYRNEMNMDDEAIIAAMQKKFYMSESDARKNVLTPAGT